MLAHVSRARFAWFRSPSLTLAFAALACTACTGAGEDAVTTQSSSLANGLVPEKADALAAVPWTTIGTGVTYKQFGEGTDVFIAYGGYLAEEVAVQRWADEVVRAKLGAAGVGHIYAVQGPNQSAYANQEIQNSHLAAHLAADGRSAGANAIIVAAHSSGTFVSAEFFQQMSEGLAGPAAATLAKVSLFSLDGGGTSGSVLSKMANAYYVYACDSKIGRCSENSSSMKALGAEYQKLGGAVEVDSTGSGCSPTASGGLWCLHDTLVTNHPHNPTFYDLQDDYTDFSTDSRVVVTSYLSKLKSTAAAPTDASDTSGSADSSD